MKGWAVGKYIVSAGRAFVSLFLVAMFSLVAGKATPAYALAGPTLDGTGFDYGVYIDGSVVDDSGTLSPSSASFTDGSFSMASPLWTTNASDSAGIGVPLTAGAGIAVSASLVPGSVNATMALIVLQGADTGLELTAGGDVIMWDTFLTDGGGVVGGTGTVTLNGHYTTTGITSGIVQLDDAYFVPGNPSLFYEINYQTLLSDTTGGSIDVSQTFPINPGFGIVQLLWTVSGGAFAYNPGAAPALFDVDPPLLSVTLPDGVSYTDASGVDYGGDFTGGETVVPEPATLTLLGLGLTGLVAKFARRRNR